MQGGAVSSLLHRVEDIIKPATLATRPFIVPFMGCGGAASGDDAFSCFNAARGNSVPPIMVWVAGGIGITPFAAMFKGLVRAKRAAAVVLLWSCRGLDDAGLLGAFEFHTDCPEDAGDNCDDGTMNGNDDPGLSIKVVVFNTSPTPDDDDDGTSARTSTSDDLDHDWLKRTHAYQHKRRMNQDDVALHAGAETHAFVCGPPALSTDAVQWLGVAGVAGANIKKESFSF